LLIQVDFVFEATFDTKDGIINYSDGRAGDLPLEGRS
jgi:hypothetical protein